MPLGPAEVHPEEHLGPVGCLGAAGAGADREKGAALVVFTREEQGGPLPGEVRLEGRRLAVQLRGELGIRGFFDELERRDQVVGAPFEASPQLDLVAQAVRLTEDFLGGSLVVPEPRLAGLRLELCGARFLGPEVKDAPRSTGSAPRGRGWWTRPPSSGPADPGAGSGGAR